MLLKSLLSIIIQTLPRIEEGQSFYPQTRTTLNLKLARLVNGLDVAWALNHCILHRATAHLVLIGRIRKATVSDVWVRNELTETADATVLYDGVTPYFEIWRV